MKKLCILLSAISLLSVNCKKVAIENKKPNLSIIIRMPYNKAEEQLGKPLETEIFDNAEKGLVFPGKRAGIGAFIKSGTPLKIKEAIWQKNDSMLIAVWYAKKQGQWIPFDHFEYNKNVDF